ncbi:hypothetical protein [Dactylosporangium sp. NPDC005555]|uniref:hypothetical protein n=1 Tax=Dactylosporangium sp. NPDC005555 TaxID=3154889 RepID=UPI0033A2C804
MYFALPRIAWTVDRAVRLRQPQPDPGRIQQRQHRQRLIAEERPLVLAHHHRIEPPVRVGERLQQLGGLRPVRPRQPPAAIRVEELRHDHTMTRDEFLSRIPLPPPRRRPLLKVRRRHPPIEREPQPTFLTRPTTANMPGGARLIEPGSQ